MPKKIHIGIDRARDQADALSFALYGNHAGKTRPLMPGLDMLVPPLEAVRGPDGVWEVRHDLR